MVLAAGASRRFGGDKLLHPLGGKPLAAHIADTLAAMPLGHRIAVCPAGNPDRAAVFEERGFAVVENPDPSRGLASSLALGARRAIDLDARAMLVCLADMPYVTADHLDALLDALATADVAASEAAGIRSPPAAFARLVVAGLTRLSGDRGAREILAGAAVVPMAPAQARDFDTPGDFS